MNEFLDSGLFGYCCNKPAEQTISKSQTHITAIIHFALMRLWMVWDHLTSSSRSNAGVSQVFLIQEPRLKSGGYKIAIRHLPNLLSLSSELVHYRFYCVPLAKASLMAELNINRSGKYTPPTAKPDKDREGGTMVGKQYLPH